MSEEKKIYLELVKVAKAVISKAADYMETYYPYTDFSRYNCSHLADGSKADKHAQSMLKDVFFYGWQYYRDTLSKEEREPRHFDNWWFEVNRPSPCPSYESDCSIRMNLGGLSLYFDSANSLVQIINRMETHMRVPMAKRINFTA